MESKPTEASDGSGEDVLSDARVLIINEQSMQKTNATGITLKRVFSSWQPDCLLELRLEDDACSEDGHGQSPSSLNAEECFPIRQLLRRSNQRLGDRVNTTLKRAARRDSVVGCISEYARTEVIALRDLSPLRTKQSLVGAVDSFHPDVIYTCGASVSVLKLAWTLSRRYSAPIVIHFMDDWPHHVPGPLGPIRRVWKRRLSALLLRCYRHAKACLAISPQMADDYTNESGVPHLPLMNSVEADSLNCGNKTHDGAFVFVYAGGLHLGRSSELKTVESVLALVEAEYDVECRLRVFTTTSDAEAYGGLFDSRITEVCPPLPPDLIRRAYEKADVVVHVESQDEDLIKFTRYSISTKIPEYLMCGRPILFYGPQDIALSSYLRDNGVAKVTNSVEELTSAIGDLIAGGVHIAAMVDRARRFAQEHHSIAVGSRTLRQAIILSGSGRGGRS